MLKTISKIFISFLSLCIVFLVIGCNVDLLGLFVSNDLDERLKEKDNFVYLTTERGALSSVSGNYSFIVMTDTHVENGDITDLKKIESAITDDVKFIVNLGDISQNGKEQDIKTITEYTKTLPNSVPYYPVIGNHDIYFGNWSVWRNYIGSTRYRVDGGDFTLFILDSANAFIGKTQVDWLERELKSAKDKVFVFTHSDFFVQDKVSIQQVYDLTERARIMSILRNSGKCKNVFMGHSHERVEKEFGGVKYVNIEDYKSTLVYCLVKVNGNSVSYEFKKL